MSQHYSDPARETDPYALPDLWVTWFGSDDAPVYDDDGRPLPEGEAGNRDASMAGHYACFCFPGCLPDSDWSGPFETEEEAVEYMRRTFAGE
jgi:hypothetical protein